MINIKKIILGITGASGSIYAKTFIEAIAGTDIHVHIIASNMGKQVIEYELSTSLENIVENISQETTANFAIENSENFFSKVASGSYKTDGMVILPCSMSTIGSVAQGTSHNLLHRAASVCLKEKRKLIIAFRESPLSAVDLSNMLALANNGATIMPLAPGFYHKPDSLEDIINFMVGKILDNLEIENNLFKRWDGF